MDYAFCFQLAKECPRAIQMLRQCSGDVLRMLVTGGPPVRGGGGIAHASRSVRVSICERNCHQRPLTTLMMFGMPLALLRSQLISISVPQPRPRTSAPRRRCATPLPSSSRPRPRSLKSSLSRKPRASARSPRSVRLCRCALPSHRTLDSASSEAIPGKPRVKPGIWLADALFSDGLHRKRGRS